jgi:ferredoxin
MPNLQYSFRLRAAINSKLQAISLEYKKKTAVKKGYPAMSIYVDSEKCNGCGTCISICPVEAISNIQNKAVINHNKCNECLQCMDECPSNAIYQISDKEIFVIKRQNSIPDSVNLTSTQPKQALRTDRQKQPVTEIDKTFLSEIKRMANIFLRNEPPFGRRKRSRRKGLGRHRKGYGRGRH